MIILITIFLTLYNLLKARNFEPTVHVKEVNYPLANIWSTRGKQMVSSSRHYLTISGTLLLISNAVMQIYLDTGLQLFISAGDQT